MPFSVYRGRRSGVFEFSGDGRGLLFRGETWRMRVVFGLSWRRRRDVAPFPKRTRPVAELQWKRCVVPSREKTARSAQA